MSLHSARVRCHLGIPFEFLNGRLPASTHLISIEVNVAMADRERRGMLIKNTGTETVSVTMDTRTLDIGPGEEKFITPEEVRDDKLREALQIRTISIVRPATKQEDLTLQEQLGNGE